MQCSTGVLENRIELFAAADGTAHLNSLRDVQCIEAGLLRAQIWIRNDGAITESESVNKLRS